MSIFFRRCLFSHFQETHLESIGENEFLFAKGEFDVDKLFVLVDFYNRTFAKFLMDDSAINTNRFQFCFMVVRRLQLLQ